MKFDLNELNPGMWFEYEDGSFSVQVRLCAGVDLERIFKATEKKRVEYKRGGRFEYFDIDHDKRDELMWDFCIMDWNRIEDGKGKELPCTTENKLLLMKGSVLFSEFIADCLEKARDAVQDAKDGQEKNLQTSA